VESDLGGFMRCSKLLALILFLLPLAASAAAEAPTSDDGVGSPMVVAALLLGLGVGIVLVGIGIIVALAALACSALFVSFGIVSTSALIALLRRRMSAGVRALHYQLFALAGAPCGVIVFGLGASWFHLQLRDRYILLFGLLAGMGAGVTMAFLFDRVASLIYRRFVGRNAAGS
jgi:hypothetical protein